MFIFKCNDSKTETHYLCVTVYYKSMKLDFGGLGSTAPPLFGSSSSSEFLDGFSTTPSFELPPSTIDVSLNVFSVLSNFIFT